MLLAAWKHDFSAALFCSPCRWSLPIIIHLINQRRYQTIRWAAMMFLLAANRMSRGYARLRQWLIMAFRMLAIAGLIFAVSRPLASGWLGLAAGGRPIRRSSCSTVRPACGSKVRGRRSPSWKPAGSSWRERLAVLGSGRWVLIESTTNAARARVARRPVEAHRRRAGQRVGRPAGDAGGGPRLHQGQPGGPHRDLDLLRPPPERLERRQRPLAGAARRVPRAPAGRPLPPAGLSDIALAATCRCA